MKLHLPISLRKSLLALFAVVFATTLPSLDAATMDSDVSLITYADYGQNLGRYKTDATANALLHHIRKQDGGVVLTYVGGQNDYLLPHEMPNFTGTTINGGKIILSTGGDYELYNTISGGTLEVAGGTTLVNKGHTVSSALVLQDKSAVTMTGSNTLTSARLRWQIMPRLL